MAGHLVRGIWGKAATPDVGEFPCFTITGDSAGMLADFHTRPPVIREPEDYDVWMHAAEVWAAVRAYRVERPLTAIWNARARADP